MHLYLYLYRNGTIHWLVAAVNGSWADDRDVRCTWRWTNYQANKRPWVTKQGAKSDDSIAAVGHTVPSQTSTSLKFRKSYALTHEFYVKKSLLQHYKNLWFWQRQGIASRRCTPLLMSGTIGMPFNAMVTTTIRLRYDFD